MSMSTSGQDANDALEAACRRGCRRVTQVIASLRGDAIPEELSGLDPDLRRRVLEELQSVMAVYDRECSLDPDEPI